ncbi:MAG TPA: endonuclease/exonuclease/phosphatase family protein, partial [Paracoccaceae bacterium]|nr:endonuclease/exonuclease/phosphatase family protein [Paracoccaceae bacterium]
VASWNIHKGVGADRRRDMLRTARVIADLGADLVALQEADLRFGTRAGLLDLDLLRAEAGLVPVPTGRQGPSHGWHGNLILVREAEVRHVQRLTLPGFEPRGALVSDLQIRGRQLRVIAAHFGLLPRSRRRQSRALADLLDGETDPHPTLLMGDLNEWRTGAGSPLAPLTRHFRPAIAPRSYPARFPFLPLDRLMACHRGELHDIAVHDTPLARAASDHLPLTARLILP